MFLVFAQLVLGRLNLDEKEIVVPVNKQVRPSTIVVPIVSHQIPEYGSQIVQPENVHDLPGRRQHLGRVRPEIFPEIGAMPGPIIEEPPEVFSN